MRAPQLDQHEETLTDETVLVPSGCISSGAGWQLVDAVSCGVRDESGLIEDTVYHTCQPSATHTCKILGKNP